MDCATWQTLLERRNDELVLRKANASARTELQLVDTSVYSLNELHERRKVEILRYPATAAASSREQRKNKQGQLYLCPADRTITRTSAWQLQYRPEVPYYEKT